MTEDFATSISVTIDAPVDRVWLAITTPELIKRWFFGVDTRSSWTEGGELVHTGELNGRPYEDKGVIVRIEPPTLLEHTHWSPMAGRPDHPENYETVTYRLTDLGGTSKLTVSEVNLPSMDAKTISEKAWRSALDALKEQCESGGART